VQKGNVRNEGNQLPSTPITEGVLQRDDAKMNRYVAAMNKSMAHAKHFTMDGGKYQSTNPGLTAMADFKATALLQERNKAQFEGRTGITEQDAVRSRQSKANPRPNQPRIETLVNDAASDAEFLNAINSRSLIKE
jgi:spore germination cell wall hydrolase CwlJ-like protein